MSDKFPAVPSLPEIGERFMKAQRIVRAFVMTAKDRRFENLLRRAAEALNRRNCDVGTRPNAQKPTAVA